MITINLNTVTIKILPTTLDSEVYAALKEIWHKNRMLQRYRFPVEVIGGETVGTDDEGFPIVLRQFLLPANGWNIVRI